VLLAAQKVLDRDRLHLHRRLLGGDVDLQALSFERPKSGLKNSCVIASRPIGVPLRSKPRRVSDRLSTVFKIGIPRIDPPSLAFETGITPAIR
jgi:hypothetical protein